MEKFALFFESILKGNKHNIDDLKQFLKIRSKGAKKIQASAEANGGFATLTSIHFKAKETPYKQCEKHLTDQDSTFFKTEAEKCFEKLKEWNKMSQREFQHVMGQLEAYGEMYIRSLETKGK